VSIAKGNNMARQIQRYGPSECDPDTIVKQSDGIYVLYEDVAPLLAELSQQATNNARVEICPHRDTWTIIGNDGRVMYKFSACIKGGQTPPVA
jgi:hypothetical protein